MASRGGPRAAGTDGGDFGHREIIKEQYYVRNQVDYKGRPCMDFGLSPRKNRPRSDVINNDPGVNDSDEEDGGYTFHKYSDSQAVLNEIAKKARELQANADAQHQYQQQQQQKQQQQQQRQDQQQVAEDMPLESDLPLSGDYRGMGGPDTIPLFSDEGVPFEPPIPRPHRPCILDELFLTPSDDQLRAFRKIETKRLNATNKSRLKWCITSHFLLFVFVLAKLVPEILDRLDIFVLELEELFIPKSHFWEWLWLLSFPFTYFGIYASNKNNISSMKKFMSAIVLLAVLPVAMGVIIHFPDVYTYLASGRKAEVAENMLSWKGYPIAILWYFFYVVAFQVHAFELYFAYVLIKAWAPKRKSQ